ncbi:MAG: hypothetical protein Q9228_005785 [Teloschistes exilis]
MAALGHSITRPRPPTARGKRRLSLVDNTSLKKNEPVVRSRPLPPTMTDLPEHPNAHQRRNIPAHGSHLTTSIRTVSSVVK